MKQPGMQRLLLILLTGLLTTPVLALTGRVVDSDNKPVEGASVCYRSGRFDQQCVKTDATGNYLLLQAPGTKIRISALGFVPKLLPAVDQEKPIQLETAASIKILLVDATTGEPIPAGQVWLVRSSGRKIGPFPPNAQGVQIGTLEPGDVVVQAHAEGYRSAESSLVKLRRGELVEHQLQLEPEGGK